MTDRGLTGRDGRSPSKGRLPRISRRQGPIVSGSPRSGDHVQTVRQ